MDERCRQDLVNEIVESGIKLGTEKSINKFDELIYTDYYCEHDYGVRNIDGIRCVCLDCGDAVSEYNYGKLYEVKPEADLRNIRRKYLKFLQKRSSEGAIDKLSEETGMTLRREIIGRPSRYHW